MSKNNTDNMEPIVTGNTVTLPIRKAGNAVTLAEYIAFEVNTWLAANPGKKIIDTPIPDVVTPNRQRRGYVNSVKFSFEIIPETKLDGNVIKNVSVNQDGSYILSLRTDDYGKRMSKFLNLKSIAQHDFPHLTDDDLRVVIYGGDTQKGIPGLEFSLPKGTIIPGSYQKIGTLEYTIK